MFEKQSNILLHVNLKNNFPKNFNDMYFSTIYNIQNLVNILVTTVVFLHDPFKFRI